MKIKTGSIFNGAIAVFVMLSMGCASMQQRPHDIALNDNNEIGQHIEKTNTADVPEMDDDVGEVMVPIRKGNPAPFTGTLASPEAIAKIIAVIESQDEKMRIEIDRVRDLERAGCKRKTDIAAVDLETCENSRQVAVSLRDEEIKRLSKELESSSSPTWWIVGGANGGFSGYISDLWYYDYALSVNEISKIASKGLS